MTRIIVHVAEIDISKDTGMGRVSYAWKHEFERRGYEFIHIGPNQVGNVHHRACFPYAAFKIYQQLKLKPSLILVHEPASGVFIRAKVPIALFSHGAERRAWNLSLQENNESIQKPSLKTRLLFPYWRLRLCDWGLRYSDLLLLINQDDCDFIQNYYCRKAEHIFQFQNGVNSSTIDETIVADEPITILFLGSWINRKGIKTLVEAAQRLHCRNLSLKWLLAGTGLEQSAVLQSWPEYLHPHVEIFPSFPAKQEQQLFARSHLFVLPSFFEGQPLSLLQAMAAGRCCITTNCCGQKDLIQHGYNGLLHEPGDAEELANLIERCVLDSMQRVTYGARAKASVKHRTWETVSVEVVDRLEELLQHF